MEWLSELLDLVVHLLQIWAGFVLIWGAYLAISQKAERRAAPGGCRPVEPGTAFEGRTFRVA
ncbi:MAG TPA: hypothetical protein VH600_14365 [Burkholderiales bacterium]|jgi:hypothetical protein